MADNILITPGTGATVRTKDNGSGAQAQVITIDAGADPGENLITAGQKVMANSLPIVIASDQSAFPVISAGNAASGATDSGNPVKVGGKYNLAGVTLADGQRGDLQLDANGYLKVNTRLLTAGDLVTIAGGQVNANASLYDAFGNGIRGVTPTGGVFQLQVNTHEAVQIANWNAQVITSTPVVTQTLLSRNFRELIIAVNISAVNTGVTFSWQLLDGNLVFLTAWSETYSATNGNLVITVGPGYTQGTNRNVSLGLQGQLSVVAVGTNATIKGSAWLKT